jgi:hypothetical protein
MSLRVDVSLCACVSCLTFGFNTPGRVFSFLYALRINSSLFFLYICPPAQLDGKNDDFWICVADQQIVVGRGSFVWKHIILVAELRKFQARDDACCICRPFKYRSNVY